MQKYQKQMGVLILMLVFATLFIRNTRHDFPLIFQKDLRAHDESSNSVVAANITRKFFPPMVRVNPLVDQQGNWMEGPFWQHIPPLFAYVPYIFFKIDGQITIEVKRLSYAFVTLLTGLLFIWSVYKFRKSLLATLAGTIAAIFWIYTPFTHELITGYAFGVSDIVLAFSVVCSFSAILWYLKEEKSARLNYSVWKLAGIGILMALPIIAKNLLGAIPAATFLGLLVFDYRRQIKKYWPAVFGFAGILILYFGSLYLSSPETFKKEIIVPLFHAASGYEGWGRPWHWYLTNYLPQRYLFRWTWVYYLGFILSLGTFVFRIKNKESRIKRGDKILLLLSGGWFLWNLAAITLIQSKIPNFIYQSYLLSLFFIVYSVAIAIPDLIGDPDTKPYDWIPAFAGMTILLLTIFATGYESVRFAKAFKAERAQPYSYSTEHEKFYQAAEELRSMGLGTNDLIVVRLDDSDCWFRYYPLFLTGTESKALLELNFGYDAGAIKQKYRHMYFVVNKKDQVQNLPINSRFNLANYSLIEFDLSKLSISQIEEAVNSFLADHKTDIAADILRIKKDKTSCQWLVPDPILNAP